MLRSRTCAMAAPLRMSSASGRQLLLLCARPVIRSTGTQQLGRQLCSQGTGEIRMVAKREMEHFWEKNRKMRRPWSPHLTIYNNSITMFTSFIHRVSGIAMGLAWPVLGAAGFLVAGNWNQLVEKARGYQLMYPLVFCAKAAICFLPVYHMINGCRHLAYDAGYGFDLAVTKKTGVLVISLAILCTLLVAAIRVQPPAKGGHRKAKKAATA